MDSVKNNLRKSTIAKPKPVTNSTNNASTTKPSVKDAEPQVKTPITNKRGPKRKLPVPTEPAVKRGRLRSNNKEPPKSPKVTKTKEKAKPDDTESDESSDDLFTEEEEDEPTANEEKASPKNTKSLLNGDKQPVLYTSPRVRKPNPKFQDFITSPKVRSTNVEKPVKEKPETPKIKVKQKVKSASTTSVEKDPLDIVNMKPAPDSKEEDIVRSFLPVMDKPKVLYDSDEDAIRLLKGIKTRTKNNKIGDVVIPIVKEVEKDTKADKEVKKDTKLEKEVKKDTNPEVEVKTDTKPEKEVVKTVKKDIKADKEVKIGKKDTKADKDTKEVKKDAKTDKEISKDTKAEKELKKDTKLEKEAKNDKKMEKEVKKNTSAEKVTKPEKEINSDNKTEKEKQSEPITESKTDISIDEDTTQVDQPTLADESAPPDAETPMIIASETTTTSTPSKNGSKSKVINNFSNNRNKTSNAIRKYTRIPADKKKKSALTDLKKKEDVRYFLTESEGVSNRTKSPKASDVDFNKLVRTLKSVKLPASNWKIRIVVSRQQTITEVTFTNKEVNERCVKFSRVFTGYVITFGKSVVKLAGAPNKISSFNDVTILLDIIHNLSLNDPILQFVASKDK